MLSHPAGGRNRTIMLGADELAAVSAAVERYRAAKAELKSAGEAGLSQLLSRRAAARRGR